MSDPVIYVRGSPPNRTTNSGPYNTNPSDFSQQSTSSFRWHLEMYKSSEKPKMDQSKLWSHQVGNYPPEVCPGETDDSFTVTMEATPEAINAWLDRHENCTQWLSGGIPFRGNQSRVCSAQKPPALLNDPYRVPYENWEVFDAKLTALVSNGKISEIKVENGGQMYVASDVRVAGTGSGVDILQYMMKTA